MDATQARAFTLRRGGIPVALVFAIRDA